MIQIKYNLKQIGNSREFETSNQLEKLSNNNGIFYVIGENGKGKSFLLSLLAYALKAHRYQSNNMDTNLKSKIESLGDSSKYALSYNIEITLPNTQYRLICSKEIHEEGKIIRKHFDGQEIIIGDSQISQVLEVIFDVPNNIEDRLKRVKDEIIEELRQYQKKIQKKTEDFSLLIFQVNNVQDEQIINDQSTTIQKHLDQIIVYESDLKGINNVIIKLTAFKELNELNELFDKQKSISQRQKSLVTKLQGKKKPIVSIPNRKLINQLNVELSDSKNLYTHRATQFTEIINCPSNATFSSQILSLYSDEIHNVTFFKTDQNILYDDFCNGYTELTKKIPSIAEELVDNSKVHYIELIERLIDILDSSEEGITEKLSIIFGDVPTLSSKLKGEILKYDVKDFNKVSKELINILKSINTEAKDIINTEKKISKAQNSYSLSTEDKQLASDFEELKAVKSQLEEIPKQIATKQNHIKTILNIEDRWVNNQESCSSYIDAKMSDADIRESKNKTNYGIDIQKKIREQTETKIDGLKSTNRNCEAVIRNERAKPAALLPKDQIEMLESLEEKLIRLNSNLTSITDYLNNVGNYNYNSDINTDDIEMFIGELIAESLNNVLPLDNRIIKVQSYNYKEDYFLSDSLEKYYLSYVSTGLSSASYLMHKIRSSTGQFKLILLDEVGNMSERSRQMVVHEVRSLQEQNKLINMIMARVENGRELEIMEVI